LDAILFTSQNVNYMKFSLITVTYNSSVTLSDTIQSVLSQSYFNIEYIVIDGGSTDSTIEIIKKYESLFGGRMFWISEVDSGLYDAMNKGIQMATGDIIGFINSDDIIFDPKAIEKIVRCFYQNGDIDGVYSDLYYVSHTDLNKIIRYWVTGKQRPFQTGWHPAHPTFYIKRKIYEKYGLFDLDYKFAADFELMLRFTELKKIKLVYFAEPLVKMRIGGTTSKNLNNICRGNLECLQAFKKNGIKVSILYPLQRLIPKIRQFFSRSM